MIELVTKIMAKVVKAKMASKHMPRILRKKYVAFDDMPHIRGIVIDGYILINRCSCETGSYIMFEDVM